jgi:hypothetical protein
MIVLSAGIDVRAFQPPFANVLKSYPVGVPRSIAVRSKPQAPYRSAAAWCCAPIEVVPRQANPASDTIRRIRITKSHRPRKDPTRCVRQPLLPSMRVGRLRENASTPLLDRQIMLSEQFAALFAKASSL